MLTTQHNTTQHNTTQQSLFRKLSFRFLILLTLMFFFSFSNSVSAQCDFEIKIEEDSDDGCTKVFNVLLDFNNLSSVNALMIDFKNAQFEYDDVSITTTASTLGFVYNNLNGELILFTGSPIPTNNIANQVLVTISVDGKPGMCVNDFLEEASYILNGTPVFIDITNCVNIYPDPSCFRDAETICGNIQNGNGNCNGTSNEAIVGATVNADDGCGNPVSGTTDSNGDYCVEIFEGECVDVSVDNTKCPECENAITEHDAIYLKDIRDLFLGITNGNTTPLTTAQILAADINGDGMLSTLDMVFLTRLVDGYSVPFEVEGCRFHPVSLDVADNPFGPFSQSGNSCDGMDFIMVVPGDINGNCGGCDFTISKKLQENNDPNVYTLETNNNNSALSFSDNYNAYFLSFEVNNNFDASAFFNLIEKNEFDYVLEDNILSVYVSNSNDTWGNGYLYYHTNDVQLIQNNGYTINESGVSKINNHLENRSNVDVSKPITIVNKHEEIEIIFNKGMSNVSLRLIGIGGHVFYNKEIRSVQKGAIERVKLSSTNQYMFLNITTSEDRLVESILNLN